MQVTHYHAEQAQTIQIQFWINPSSFSSCTYNYHKRSNEVKMIFQRLGSLKCLGKIILKVLFLIRYVTHPNSTKWYRQYCRQLFFRNENLSKKLIKFVTRLSCLQQPSKQQLPFINRRRLLQKILNSPFHSEFTLKLKYIVGYCFFCFTNITCCTQSEHKINCIDAQFPPSPDSFFTKYKRYSQKNLISKFITPICSTPQRDHPPNPS